MNTKKSLGNMTKAELVDMTGKLIQSCIRKENRKAIRETAHLLPMKERIEFWKNERDEWLSFLADVGDLLPNSEFISVLGQLRVIDNIIDKLEKPTSFQEKERKRKQMLKEAW